ncbi:MAG: lysophospholipid acyltransferase family protein [Candidatus Binatia bacterium]
MPVKFDDPSLAVRFSSTSRLALFYPFSVLVLLAIGLVTLFREGRRNYYRLARLWAGGGLWINGIAVESYGGEKLDPTRDYVIVANHRSQFDPFAIIKALPDIETRWVAKRELLRVPLFGPLLRRTGQILVNRGDHEQAVAELQRNVGVRGLSVVFFPEGSRSDTLELRPFRKGAAAFALDAGLPVVPVAISGSEKVLPKYSRWVRGGTIRVKVGEPIDTAAMAIEDRHALTALIQERVEQLLGDLESRPAPGKGPFESSALER